MKKRLVTDKKGFTIIELIIASSVFGVVLLIAMTGILYIGRAYYKGIITSRTQETARSIVNEISSSFQYGGVTPVTSPAVDESTGFRAQCIGKFRYSYVLDSRVNNNSDPGTSRHALWLDVIGQGKACVPLDLNLPVPEDDNTDKTSPDALAQRRELLPTNMRIDEFDVQQPAGRSFLNVNIRLIFGEQDLSPEGTCIQNRFGGQFCAVSDQRTTVKKRL